MIMKKLWAFLPYTLLTLAGCSLTTPVSEEHSTPATEGEPMAAKPTEYLYAQDIVR
jgi:hypothetical protein